MVGVHTLANCVISVSERDRWEVAASTSAAILATALEDAAAVVTTCRRTHALVSCVHGNDLYRIAYESTSECVTCSAIPQLVAQLALQL